MQPLDPQPALIDRAYERLVEVIADGTLAPRQRIRQEELGRALGVSRQPISPALQLLKQQKLVEENGRRGLIVLEIDPDRVRDLYQVRSALAALAARLAAKRVARRLIAAQQQQMVESALAAASRCRWMLRCSRSSKPTSRFTPCSIAYLATGRSRTSWRRNGRI